MTRNYPPIASGNRILGFDVGLKRIGIAQSDLLGMLASPVGTFNHQEITDRIQSLMNASPISHAVVGWPVSLRGHENETTALVQQFINRLKNRFPELHIITLDERFTSEMAKQAILDSGTSRKKRQQKGLIDSVAATIILQNFLDQNR